jgi:hypothetical protein
MSPITNVRPAMRPRLAPRAAEIKRPRRTPATRVPWLTTRLARLNGGFASGLQF